MSLDLDTTKIRTQAPIVAIPRQGPCCLRGLFYKGWKMEGEHTKGKWIVQPSGDFFRQYLIRTPDDMEWHYRVADENERKIQSEEDSANARLIAAAPDLLEVCKRASKAHCLRGTILQHDLIKAIAKAEKEGGL